jgi:branched-chain amino acid transport system ATP-binding protein
MSTLLDVQGITKRFGGLVAVDNATISVEAGSITGLIGPNGAGKTTLFTVISGFETPQQGRVVFAGRDVTRDPVHVRAMAGLARTFQIVQPFTGLSVRENIAVGSFLRHADRATALAKASEVGEAVGLGPLLDRPAGALTVAGRKRLELARALATGPKLLLLDEVLAGLNPSEIRDMIPVVR